MNKRIDFHHPEKTKLLLCSEFRNRYRKQSYYYVVSLGIDMFEAQMIHFIISISLSNQDDK